MAAILRIADAARNAQLNGIRDLIDAGAGPGLLRIYDGSQPADADDAVTTQNLLAELPLSDPCAPDAAAGVLTFSAITQQNALDTGMASWARVVDSDDNPIMDCNVGTNDETCVLNTTSIVAGGPVQIVSMTLSAPAG